MDSGTPISGAADPAGPVPGGRQPGGGPAGAGGTVPSAAPGQPDVMSLPIPATGDEAVDETLTALATLTELPVGEHPRVFEDVHQQLSEALSRTGGRGGTAGPGS